MSLNLINSDFFQFMFFLILNSTNSTKFKKTILIAKSKLELHNFDFMIIDILIDFKLLNYSFLN